MELCFHFPFYPRVKLQSFVSSACKRRTIIASLWIESGNSARKSRIDRSSGPLNEAKVRMLMQKVLEALLFASVRDVVSERKQLHSANCATFFRGPAAPCRVSPEKDPPRQSSA